MHLSFVFLVPLFKGLWNSERLISYPLSSKVSFGFGFGFGFGVFLPWVTLFKLV